jgi:hypothetical protein
MYPQETRQEIRDFRGQAGHMSQRMPTVMDSKNVQNERRYTVIYVQRTVATSINHWLHTGPTSGLER